MKHFKRLSFILVLVFFTIPFYLQGEPAGEKIIAMCRPSVAQIKNIEHLYEKNLITLDRIKLICVYHADEKSDYALPTGYEPSLEYYDLSYEYVKENKLTWVEFRKITGKVDTRDLFKENTWTPQLKEIFDRADGIIFTGGADIPPAIYGAETNLFTGPSTPMRNMYEISFLFHLIGNSKERFWVIP